MLVHSIGARAQFAERPTPARAPVASPVILAIDNDREVRTSLAALAAAQGWRCETFDSATDFLSRPAPDAPSCLLLDVNLPNFDSPDLHARMAARCSRMPVIFVTGRDDIPATVRATKPGALEFLIKPLDEATLRGALGRAISRSAEASESEADLRELRTRHATLSGREREVMDLVVAGLLNKQVGSRLDISEVTVKVHRGRVMEKMRATSFAELVKISLRLRAGSQWFSDGA